MNFYNSRWRNIGTKSGLQNQLATITGIPTRILRGGSPDSCSIAQRMSWASQRVTTRIEDLAYCLLGLFDVNMPMLYGEGPKAFTRLQEEIIKQSNDHTIFAWRPYGKRIERILAPTPASFRDSGDFAPIESLTIEHYNMTNVGLSISLRMVPWAMNIYLALLECRSRADDLELMPRARIDAEKRCLGIFLRQTHNDMQFARTSLAGEGLLVVEPERDAKSFKLQRVLLLNKPSSEEEDILMYGLAFRHLTFTLFPGFPYFGNREHVKMHGKTQDSVKLYEGFNEYVMYEEGGISFTISNTERFDRMKVGKVMNETPPILISEMHSGQSGTLVSFSLKTEPNKDFRLPESWSFETDPAPVAKINFGFDFYFNPICTLWSERYAPNKERDDHTWDDEEDFDSWLSKLDHYESGSAAASWHHHGTCSLRGSRKLGLQAELDFLNVAISITRGWVAIKERAWLVDVRTLQPPLPARTKGLGADTGQSEYVPSRSERTSRDHSRDRAHERSPGGLAEETEPPKKTNKSRNPFKKAKTKD